jgi:hypothetical protein
MKNIGIETGDFDNPELLEAHRELQALRAAGVAGAHRRRGRASSRNLKPTNKNSEQLESWAEERLGKEHAV